MLSLKFKEVVVKTKAKKRYVHISIDDYSLKTKIKQWFRDKVISIRRSKLAKETYKKLFQLVGMLPAHNRLVMFESYLGKQYSCNPRAIYEYLREHHPEYKMYWSVDGRYIHNFLGKDIKYVKRFSMKWLFLMALAKYWVTNSRMPLWIPKPKRTIYLQTWHGTPLKRLAADMEEVHMPGTTTEEYKKNFYLESRNWDYLISPNPYSTKIFRRAFQFEKEIIESGYPRNDFLYTHNTPEVINELKKMFGLPHDKKVILYAPTWRDDQFYTKGKYKFNLELDLSEMMKQLGDRYVVILRMHYLVAENLDLSSYQGFAYDFSNHGDIRELYLISDLLITDYSSVFFDYANLKRPMIFFVYDIENYRDKLRGFYFDFEKEAPGPLVRKSEEVIEKVIEFEQKGYRVPDNFDAFYHRFCSLESGISSKRVVESVFLENRHV